MSGIELFTTCLLDWAPCGRATHQAIDEGRDDPDGIIAVRLNSCLEASGVQAMPRNARIDVEDVDHVVPNIGASAVPCIATKERMAVPCSEPRAVSNSLSTRNGLRANRSGFACQARGGHRMLVKALLT